MGRPETDYQCTDKGFRMLRDDRFLALAAQRYVAFDLETTGLSPERDGITEIGAIRVEKGRITERYQTLVNPGVPISDYVQKLTGITNEMVSGARTFAEVLPEFVDFIGEDPYVAHNAPFDIGFLEVHARRCGRGIPPAYADSLPLARAYWPKAKSHKLGDMARIIGFDMGRAHRSMADTEALVALVNACVTRCAQSSFFDADDKKSVPAANDFLAGMRCAPPPQMPGIDCLRTLRQILEKAWDRDTCEPGMAPFWCREDPSLGQEDVTARLVGHLCGCEVIRFLYPWGREGLGNRHDGTVFTLCGPEPGIVRFREVIAMHAPQETCREAESQERFRQLQRHVIQILKNA